MTESVRDLLQKPALRFVTSDDFQQLVHIFPRSLECVEVFDGLPGIAVVKVKLQWWTKLTFGIVPWWFKRKASRIIDKHRVVGVLVQLKVID